MAKLTAKEKVITAAQELMTGRGYSATSVDTIVQRAGVAKGSFYHAFKSKEELALAALEDYAIKGWQAVASGPYRDIQDPIDRALAFVDFLELSSEALWSHGCLLGSVAVEVADSHPDLIERVNGLFQRFEEKFAQIFAPALAARSEELATQGLEEKGVVANLSAQELAVHLLAVIEGSIITARSHFEQQHLQNGLRHFRNYLALLLGRAIR